MLITRNGYSLADVAINAAGTLEALWSIAAANGVSVSDIPEAGNYTIPASVTTDNSVLKYMGAKGIEVATLGNTPAAGVAYMEIGSDFIIS